MIETLERLSTMIERYKLDPLSVATCAPFNLSTRPRITVTTAEFRRVCAGHRAEIIALLSGKRAQIACKMGDLGYHVDIVTEMSTDEADRLAWRT